jgi:hypothetical protein
MMAHEAHPMIMVQPRALSFTVDYVSIVCGKYAHHWETPLYCYVCKRNEDV